MVFFRIERFPEEMAMETITRNVLINVKHGFDAMRRFIDIVMGDGISVCEKTNIAHVKVMLACTRFTAVHKENHEGAVLVRIASGSTLPD